MCVCDGGGGEGEGGDVLYFLLCTKQDVLNVETVEIDGLSQAALNKQLHEGMHVFTSSIH